jgi:catechol 2,3-dioxygenase-like lactoylglutathione lyase family enzyme
MFDRVTIRATDPSASERFYREMLAMLDIAATGKGEGGTRWNEFAVEVAGPDRPPTRHLHLAFVAPSREHIDEFWQVGTDAGYEDAGPPRERPQYTRGYYGAFLRNPDGNSVEAVRHRYVRGGNLDHLWIRVPDVAAAAAFYEAVASQIGLREGRRWEQGRQFRGARSTFSLVDDGAPLTEGLQNQMAFPVHDIEAVDAFQRAALVAGYRDDRPPAQRDSAYTARIVDPLGNGVEATFPASG